VEEEEARWMHNDEMDYQRKQNSKRSFLDRPIGDFYLTTTFTQTHLGLNARISPKIMYECQ